MKKSILLFLSMLILLLSATSGFAEVIWGPKSSSYMFNTTESYWTPNLSITPAQIAAGTFVTINYQVLGVTSYEDISVMLRQFTPGGTWTTNGRAQDVLSPSTLTGSLTLPVVLNTTGLYSFQAWLDAPTTGVTVHFTDYTVSTAKTPLPAAALLLGTGFAGLLGYGKARRRKVKAA